MESTKKPSDGYSFPVKVKLVVEVSIRIASRTLEFSGTYAKYAVLPIEITIFDAGRGVTGEIFADDEVETIGGLEVLEDGVSSGISTTSFSTRNDFSEK